ncbi:ABC transporter substrate-binding protein [Haemophilus paracuniculus]|uniref:ABC transporter substrate-binding protein n=1 Tax=Haemophilus paracuniculus TaxID=734 RepID=A0A1T0AUP6_9PAST|nr:ABC transporter substrate-binding protein [Haemophilus paracuniculus]OOS00590.1 ABC transporter substrate-binding protein [Haemophilus paracuniculus]
MIKSLLQGVGFCFFFALLSQSHAAPKIPQDLREKSLVYCTSVSGFTFNPQKADVGTNMNVVTEQIYDKLFEIDPATNQLQPALAERYQISEDGLTITLFLRQNVQFHTTPWFSPTRPFNGEDVVFSLNRIIGNVAELPMLDLGENQSNSFRQNQRYTYQYKANLAHYPYFESVAIKNKIAKISAPTPYQVEIRLTSPDSSVLAHLASQYAVMLSKEYALQLNADENLVQLDMLPVGTGVYQLHSYVQNDYVRLEPNPRYWGKPANIQNMVVDMTSNGTGRMAKLLNGECDVVAFPEPSQLVKLQGVNILEKQGADLAFLAFNQKRPQIQDLALRKKIAQSINRERINQNLFYGLAEVADNVLPTALFEAKNPNSYPYLPNESENFEKSTRLQLWVVDEKRVYNLHPLKMAEMIRADLEKVGIETDILPVSRAYLAQRIEQGTDDYDLILTGWLANNLDPTAFLSPILSCAAQKTVTNLANWCNEEFDYWLETARLSENPQAKQLLYQLAQNLLEEQLPILPLVNGNRLLVTQKRVENATISPFGQVRLSELKLNMRGN